MIDYNMIIASLFEDFASKFRNGTCKVTKDEALTIMSNFAHIEMNKQEVADMLNVSTKTVERMSKDGRIPPPHPHRGETRKDYYMDEILTYNNLKNDEEI